MNLALKKTVMLLMLFTLTLVFTCNAFAYLFDAHIYGGIDVYEQEKPLWCWNASARMVADYRYNVTKSQTEIGKKVSGILYDSVEGNTASMKETASAIKLYTNSTKETGYSTSECSFTKIADRLDSSNNPITLGIYYVHGDYNHMLACYGYDSEDEIVYVIDPKFPYEDSAPYDTLFYSGEAENTGMAYFLTGQW